MRVAFLLTQSHGGPVDLTVGLARALASLPGGPEVAVVGPEPQTSAGDLGGAWLPAWVRHKTDLAGMRSVRDTLRGFAPDVVHAQDRRAALVAVTAARAGVPVAATVHGVPDDTGRWWIAEGPLAGRGPSLRTRAVLAGDAGVLRACRAVVTPSQAMGRFAVRRLGVRPGRLHVIPNGVTLPPAHPVRGPAVVFAHASAFAPCKAVPSLVRVFTKVAAERPALRLVLAGDGPEMPAVRAAIAAAGPAGERVELLGYRRDVPAVLARADAFVLPSWNENLPLALIEAMGAGLAPVASRVGAVAEVVRPGEGLLVPPGDDDALAVALARLADEPDLAPSLGSAASLRARAFSVDRSARAHLALYRSLTGTAAPLAPGSEPP